LNKENRVSVSIMASDTENVIKNANWWSRRSALEKSLIVTSVLAFIGVIALVLVLSVAIVKNKSFEENDSTASSTNKSVCLTSGCIKAASHALSNMDNSVNPCDDFYSYACGNFVKKTIIPDGQSWRTEFTKLNDKVLEKLRILLSDKINSADPRPFNLAKNLYKSCMNKSLIEEHGLKPLTDITESLGGWPVVLGDSWDEESTWTWTGAVIDYSKKGFQKDYIFDVSVGISQKDSTKHIIDIDQPQLGLNLKYLTNGLSDNLVQAYYKYMVDMAVIFGADKSRAEKELLDSLNFEIALANMSWSNEKRRNVTAMYNLFTIKEVQQKYPYISWVEYINALLPTNVNIDENEVVSISVPSFFDNFGNLLENTPKRTIANYLLWRITAYSSFFLSDQLRKRQLMYNTVVSGKQDQMPRWWECTYMINERFKIVAGALYVRKHFKEETKLAVINMTNRIRKEFENILRKVTWMDEQTRQAAINKLHAMGQLIGYPEELLDNDKLENYYEKLEIDPNSYFLSALNVNSFETDYAFNKLRKPIKKTDWKTDAWLTIVNASYRPKQNHIEILASILQGHFFTIDRPNYLNYGAIGFVIAHELTHGFDDKGGQYDLNGNLFNWWGAVTKSQYLKKAKCMADQYSSYVDPSTQLNLNGVYTLGENIADNGGVKESYYAYEKWVHDNGPELGLPGLDLSPQQLFWLSNAQTWCGVYRPEFMKSRILTAVHVPNLYRVRVPFSNMKEFSKDFNCPVGSSMNPIHKCEVW